MHLEFDVDFIKQIINNIIKKSNGNIFGFLMDSSVKFHANDDEFIIKVLFLKYRIKIEVIPEKASEEFVLSHNLPLDKIDKSKLPKLIKIEKNKIFIRLPKNIITENLMVSAFKMKDDKIFIEFKWWRN